jgi:LacI family transcriptional regulator
MTLDSDFPCWLVPGRVDGVIARVTSRNLCALRDLKVPVIDVCCNQPLHGIPQVETDNDRVAEMAFEHLWERGFRRFAFCGYRDSRYSQQRLRRFKAMAGERDCPLKIYESPSPPGSAITEIERAGMFDSEPIAAWLKTLDTLSGLFACNDIRGQQLLTISRSLNLAVPDDLAVIGVDNDDTICMLCDPPLSSVHLNAELVGHRAAEILMQMIAGQGYDQAVESIAPRRVQERLSTQVVAVEDREIARVCRFIRQHACDGIQVSHLVECSTLSRRQLERRFRESLGKSPREAIADIQINRAQQLLMETDMKLDEVATRSGFIHLARLHATFKQSVGITPGEFREVHSK